VAWDEYQEPSQDNARRPRQNSEPPPPPPPAPVFASVKTKDRRELYALCGRTVCLALRDVAALLLSGVALAASPVAAGELCAGAWALVGLWRRGALFPAVADEGRFTADGACGGARFQRRAAAYEQLLRLLGWLAWSRGRAAVGDLLVVPVGLLGACCPTRTLSFARALGRLAAQRVPDPLVPAGRAGLPLASRSALLFQRIESRKVPKTDVAEFWRAVSAGWLADSPPLPPPPCLVVPRGALYRLCVRTCAFAVGDVAVALPLGCAALLVPSRTAPLAAAVAAAARRPARSAADGLDLPLPGEVWAACAFK
jgi:hypothetical protein